MINGLVFPLKHFLLLFLCALCFLRFFVVNLFFLPQIILSTIIRTFITIISLTIVAVSPV
jgi:hypothetical protein